MRRAALICLASVALASCGSSTTKTITSTASAPPPPVPVYFEGVAGGSQQRPASLQLTADGTLFVGGVQWSSWGGPAATGSGNAEYHGCTPNCAQATPHTAFVSIRLFGVRSCSGRQYYSALTLTTSSRRLLDQSFVQRSWSPC